MKRVMCCVVHRCVFLQVGTGTGCVPSFFFRGDGNTVRKVRLFSQPDFCQANNFIFPGQDSGPMRNGLTLQFSLSLAPASGISPKKYPTNTFSQRVLLLSCLSTQT